MAWEHSYSASAYSDAREVLGSWSSENLARALADYNFEKFHGDTFRKGCSHRRGKWDYEKLIDLPQDILADACMEAIEDVRLCDNGGWAMWIDFDGYHKVELPQ